LRSRGLRAGVWSNVIAALVVARPPARLTGNEIHPRRKTIFARSFNAITLSRPISNNILLSFYQKM
jgi:hypothetical protein